MPMPSRWPLAFLAVFAFARGIGCNSGDDIHDENNFREDVVLCENAVAWIARCCLDIRVPGDACVHRHVKWTRDCGSCSSGTEEYEERVEPVLAIATSEGILDTSCDDLTAADGCSRLEAELAKDNRWEKSTGGCTEYGGPY